MTELDRPLELAAAGDRWTATDWETAAAGVLRKARRMTEEDPDSLVWEKLTRTTLDGIGITPLGTTADLDRTRTHGRPTRHGPWDIRSHLRGADAKVLHEEAVDDLQGGVTSLWLETGPDPDLATVLETVLLDLAPVVLDPSVDPVGTARTFLEHVRDGDLHPATNLGADASTASPEELVAVGRLALERRVLGVVVDATAVHDRGASDAQELGYSMALGAGALRILTDAGIPVAEAAGLIEFRYAATDEQFPTISKLRAARRLWARILELSEAAGTVAQRQHVVTSRPMMTRYDPYVNMLRTTVAAFAAGVGGADAVTVLPFDGRLGRPAAFGRRIARNISHLLIDESHVAAVADPAGGAYAVERLTDDLAVAAWEVLGAIESGESIDELVAGTVMKREKLVGRRKLPITGVSEFPHLFETLPPREPDDTYEGVRAYGASFEALRDDPAATRVFLATLGTVAQHTARASFATNLLAAGGIAIDPAGPTTGTDDLVERYAGQPVVCLAGSDPAYAEWGEQAASALRQAGAGWVIVAGRATDYVDDSCAMGVDALAFLHRTREKLS